MRIDNDHAAALAETTVARALEHLERKSGKVFTEDEYDTVTGDLAADIELSLATFDFPEPH